MAYRDVSVGKISGAGTITLSGMMIGGVLVSTDGTNAAVVQIRKINAAGSIVFDISSKNPIWVMGPLEAGNVIWYSISGTGATAQIFEWVVM